MITHALARMVCPIDSLCVLCACECRCARVRDLLLSHRAAVLSLSSAIHAAAGIASQTLLATLQAELTLMFGQIAQQL